MARRPTTTVAVGVLLGWGTLVWLAYEKEKTRQQLVSKNRAYGKAKPPKDRSTVLLKRSKIVDHPIFGWLFENIAVWLMALVRLNVTTATISFQKTWQGKFAVTWLALIVGERFQLLLHWLLVHNVYSHIPYFHPSDFGETSATKSSGTRLVGVPTAHSNFLRILKEWISASAASQCLLSLLFLVLRNKPQRYSRGQYSIGQFASKINPVAFCAKLAVVRVTVDVCFAVGHWLIHRPVIFYSEIVSHKTHHEHNHPSVLTNQHFSIMDLFVEAYLPAIAGLTVLQRGLRWRCNPLEEALISGYIGWQEQCSHSGKPVPFSSMLAPASIVYNHILGFRWDRRNVEFHQVHHERMRCNYSITQWLDNLLGTTRWC